LAETEAYTKALELQWDPHYRAELFLRRGHAAMRMGDLGRAIFDFRVALEEVQDPALLALSGWALAVALDRSHDLPAALPHARAAAAARFPPAGTVTALDLEWFDFEPAYEVHYYRALSQLAHAQITTQEADRVGSLEAAQALFFAYTRAASPDDPWLPRAREHTESLRDRITELLAREQERPPP
jgi:hypothetical protein